MSENLHDRIDRRLSAAIELVGQQWLQPSCYRVRYLLKLPLYGALCTQPRYTQANQLAHFQSPFLATAPEGRR